MTRLLLKLALATTLLAAALFSTAFAQADLVVQESNISVVKNTPLNTTYVTVTVRNSGALAAGAFTLRIGVSMAGSDATSDFDVAALPAGQSTSRVATFQGTDWACAWGNADIAGSVAETSENNNCAGESNYWIAILPGAIHDEHIGVVNPGLSPETVALSASAPAGWIATVYPAVLTLGPGELGDALVHIGAPSHFDDYASIEVYCNFLDGTPGVMEWEFHMESAIPVEESTWGSIKALFDD